MKELPKLWQNNGGYFNGCFMWWYYYVCCWVDCLSVCEVDCEMKSDEMILSSIMDVLGMNRQMVLNLRFKETIVLLVEEIERNRVNMEWYQHMSSRTIPNKGLKQNVSNFGLGLAGESGEVIDILKKWLYHGHTLDVKKVEEELGDLMFYVVGLCTLLGLTLEGVCTKNVVKLQKRYENGFSEEDSRRRRDVE